MSATSACVCSHRRDDSARSSCSVTPGGGALTRSCSRMPATRISKNSSRLLLTMHRKRRRSSSGTVGVLRQREDSPVEREQRKLAIDQRRRSRLDGRFGRHRDIKGAVRRSSRRTRPVSPAQVTGMLRRLSRRRPPATGTLPWRRDRARPGRRGARRARPPKARRGSAVPDPRRRSLRRLPGAA